MSRFKVTPQVVMLLCVTYRKAMLRAIEDERSATDSLFTRELAFVVGDLLNAGKEGVIEALNDAGPIILANKANLERFIASGQVTIEHPAIYFHALHVGLHSGLNPECEQIMPCVVGSALKADKSATIEEALAWELGPR